MHSDEALISPPCEVLDIFATHSGKMMISPWDVLAIFATHSSEMLISSPCDVLDIFATHSGEVLISPPLQSDTNSGFAKG